MACYKGTLGRPSSPRIVGKNEKDYGFLYMFALDFCLINFLLFKFICFNFCLLQFPSVLRESERI